MKKRENYKGCRDTYLVLNLALGPFLLLGRLGRRGGDGSFLGRHLRGSENNRVESEVIDQRLDQRRV